MPFMKFIFETKKEIINFKAEKLSKTRYVTLEFLIHSCNLRYNVMPFMYSIKGTDN